jgi:hypothetical protein
MKFQENLRTGSRDIGGSILWSSYKVHFNIMQFNFSLQRLNYIWVIRDSPLHF